MHGIKKSLNKVNQYVNEKIGTSKPTAYDETYIQMEKDVDQLIKMFYDLSSKIGDILQPNPHVRAKMAAYSHLAKIRGDTNSESYQHTTKSLANSLIRESNTFNKCTLFSEALRETGQSFGDIAQYNQEFDHTVKTKVLEVIDSIMKGKIATSVKLRRKVHSNRLMYDSRKRKDEKSIKTTQAHTKFRDSLSKSKKQMYNVVYKSQFENISILESLVNSQIELETNSLNSLENLSKKLAEIKLLALNIDEDAELCQSFNDAESFESDFGDHSTNDQQLSNQMDKFNGEDPTTLFGNMDNSRGNVRILSGETTKCVAEYDFIPENTNELKFNEGDIITIIEKIDNNWYMGALDGKEGIFPKNFVKLV